MNRWQMARYRYPAGWKKVSLTIRRVAGNRCEQCGIENGAIKANGTRVILTVAHIGAPRPTGDGWTAGDPHDKRDIRRENLRAWCQACHLSYDLTDHIRHAAETRARKKREQAQASGQLELFV